MPIEVGGGIMAVDGLERAHDRIDKLVEAVAGLVAIQDRVTHDIDTLAQSVREGFHKAPCRYAVDLCGRLCIIEDAAKETMEIKREVKRDLRGLWIGITCAVAGGVGTAIVLHLIKIGGQ